MAVVDGILSEYSFLFPPLLKFSAFPVTAINLSKAACQNKQHFPDS
jgi:hypothetical protein